MCFLLHSLSLSLQIESVLHKILHELKVLYANHAPQLKPRTSHSLGGPPVRGGNGCVSGGSSSSSSEQLTCDSPDSCSNAEHSHSVDPVTDVFNILEGSALVPFAEVIHISLSLALFKPCASKSITLF